MKTLNTPSEVMCAALCQSAMLPNIEDHFDDEILQRAEDKYHGHIRLNQALCHAAVGNGYDGSNVYNFGIEHMRFAFAGVNGSFSTIDTSGILSNTANKFLEEGWGAGDQAWRELARIRPVNDFKDAPCYRLGANLTYEKIGAGGELKHGSLNETAYSNRAETFGKLVSLTRQHIINDDMSAFTSVQYELGVGAIDAFNEIFWTQFLDNSAFFASGNNNVISGADSSLGIAGLQLAEAKFLKQKKPSGQPLAVKPEILLVPVELKATGDTLMTSEKLITGSGGVQGDTNTFRNRFKVVTSPYLSDSSYTGYSAAAWYLLADPVRMPTMDVVLLQGRDRPIVESQLESFNVLGVQFRGYHDFGCVKYEYRGGVRAAGS
ncbi:phage major capsid protein [Planctomicrobium piriforme]|uniref:Mu-like prophage major head subunit gpT n=1 Tax=Planctomicrobium piriforme TaxID=1576369 RepID=A0A1I3Q0S7_9PLAN|nr:Mu-like prophage major head subunit gpT family protein [Planctomicrobium piriforme]SFJ27077.1 Mu-like prophage major head subunit gpT [Planctomicrobium piriforme]